MSSGQQQGTRGSVCQTQCRPCTALCSLHRLKTYDFCVGSQRKQQWAAEGDMLSVWSFGCNFTSDTGNSEAASSALIRREAFQPMSSVFSACFLPTFQLYDKMTESVAVPTKKPQSLEAYTVLTNSQLQLQPNLRSSVKI